MMVEVEAKRFAGPFEDPLCEYFLQSPVGLVPKDNGKKTRLIFHLSHPRNGAWVSVNKGIPSECCTVHYPDFDEAVKLCIAQGVGCNIAKSDLSTSFRNIPLRKDQWFLLVMKAKYPVTGKVYYFVDKCLPFGSPISCAIFQRFLNAIAFLVKTRTRKSNANYLDDFLFAALLKACCDAQVRCFLDICNQINFPVALEKTAWGCTLMTFLGMLLDTVNQIICIPTEKISRVLDMIEFFLNKNNKKATVLQFQKLCGFLNFLCRAIIPGEFLLEDSMVKYLAKCCHITMFVLLRKIEWIWNCGSIS